MQGQLIRAAMAWYGLKTSPRHWNKKFSGDLKDFGFQQLSQTLDKKFFLEEHFKLGVQACLKGFVKDANIQGNIVISKYLLKIDVCMLLGVV